MSRVISIFILLISISSAKAQWNSSPLGWQAQGLGGIAHPDDINWAPANQPAALAKAPHSWYVSILHEQPLMGIAIEQNAFSLAYCRSKQGLGISTSVIRSAGLYSWRHQLAYGRQLSERWQFGLQWTLLQWSAPSENWRVNQGNWGVYGIYSIKDELQLGFGGRFPHRISQAADEQLSQTQVLECALIWRMGPDGALSTGFRSGGVAQRPWQIGYEHSVSTKFSVRIGCSGLPLRLATSFSFEWHSLQFQFGAEWDPLLLPGLGMEMNHAH